MYKHRRSKSVAGLRPVGTLLVLMLLAGLLAGCASTGATPGIAGADGAVDSLEGVPKVKNIDPLESFNRGVYAFNDDLDKGIARPIARAYAKYIPGGLRRSVSNFFSNLWEPSSMINALLQGKFQVAASTTGRFLINSTAGLLGLFDVASKLGVMEQEEDFGQTMAVWGVPDGPYLVLPFLGPSNLRDLSGLTVEWFGTDMVPILFEDGEMWGMVALRLLDSRASVLGIDDTLDLQIDPYLFLREGYRQSRLIQIYDGAPPQEEDPFEADLFAE